MDIIQIKEPDISVICDKNKLTDEGCQGAPDWIVDYERNLITVYNFEHDEMTDHTLKDKVKAGIYQDLEIDFSGVSVE